MIIDDPKNGELGEVQRRLRQIETQTGTLGGAIAAIATDTVNKRIAIDLAGTPFVGDDRPSGVTTGAHAGADSSIAIGSGGAEVQNGADGGILIGSGNAYVYAADGIGIGNYAAVEGLQGVAIGYGSSANHDRATAIGTDAHTGADDEIKLGSPANRVQITGRLNVVNRTPSGTSDSQGTTNDVCWDQNYIYVKTAVGWKRSALSTF